MNDALRETIRRRFCAEFGLRWATVLDGNDKIWVLGGREKWDYDGNKEGRFRSHNGVKSDLVMQEVRRRGHVGKGDKRK